jgi:hypothetical protein
MAAGAKAAVEPLRGSAKYQADHRFAMVPGSKQGEKPQTEMDGGDVSRHNLGAVDLFGIWCL